MNYGETIAYWYLRLNGFMPITNFVLHKAEEAIEYSADADLIAIRHPFVYEPIGGQENDWDNETFKAWELEPSKEIIAAIVEVKTGQNNTRLRNKIERDFNSDRLKYGIQRLGIWPLDKTDEIIRELLNNAVYRLPNSNSVITKILIADDMPSEDSMPPCLRLELSLASKFIEKRMKDYDAQKNSDRMFFPSDLIQYIIWKQKSS